jgi:AraC family transcriptional activator of pobA
MTTTERNKAGLMSLEILRLDWMEEGSYHTLTSPHNQQHFEIVWIQEGEGVHIINGEFYRLNHNCIYAALPGQKHELFVHPGSKGYIVSFDQNQFSQSGFDIKYADEWFLYHYFQKEPELSLKDNQTGPFQNLISLLEKEPFSNMTIQGEIIGKYIQLFQLYLRRSIEENASQKPMDKSSFLLRNFLALLEIHFKTKKSVFDYAQELNVSSNYLNNAVKRATGQTAGYHIRQRIVQEAKRKAKHSGYSMKEVAYYLGFDDLAHFSKLFKNTCGVNFSEFKRLAMAS